MAAVLQRLSTPRDANNIDAIQQTFLANVPRGIRSAPDDARRSLWKQTVGNMGPARAQTAGGQPEVNQAMEDDARTKKFWEKFAQEATRELLKDQEAYKREAEKKLLLYSGRVGIVPKHPPEIPDDVSEDTDISLLTCSEQNGDQPTRQRHKFIAANSNKKGVNWKKIAMTTYTGVLAKMINKDADTLQAVGNQGGVPRSSVLTQAQLSQMFNPEEQDMLMNAAYTRGLYGREKSGSTANILTGMFNARTPTTKVTFVNSRRSQQNAFTSRELKHTNRSTSFPDVKKPSSAASSKYKRSIYAVETSVERSSKKDPDRERSKNEYRRQVRERIHNTMYALDRIVGAGDQNYDIRTIPEENGMYTEGDYALIPRYPQNVRVAPQLVHVITAEMRRRANQTRRVELKQKDLMRFDEIQPRLDRNSRNLFIYNWLNELEEREFTDHTRSADGCVEHGGDMDRVEGTDSNFSDTASLSNVSV